MSTPHREPAAKVAVSQALELTVIDTTRKGGSVKVRLNAVDAQLVAAALLQFAGVKTGSLRGGMFVPATPLSCAQCVTLEDR